MMHEYSILTLVDITNTGAKYRRDDYSIARAQQSNLDTLLQTISLRAQPHSIGIKVFEDDPAMYGLHSSTELAKIWHLKFYVESEDVFGRECELFLADIDLVPIIPGLTETDAIFPPVFMSKGNLKNISITKCH